MSDNIISFDLARTERSLGHYTQHLLRYGFPEILAKEFTLTLAEAAKAAGTHLTGLSVAAMKVNNEARMLFRVNDASVFSFAWIPEPTFIITALLSSKLMLDSTTDEGFAKTVEEIENRLSNRFAVDGRMPVHRAICAWFFRRLYGLSCELYLNERDNGEAAFIGVILIDGTPSMFALETLPVDFDGTPT